ncbi:MAG: L-iditol 2-dehydrogenase [Kiritimatiellia bacterium]|jgi:L-iditol 2-dehydrogenase
MKALSLQAYNQFELIDVPLPEIGPEDVLIQVKAVGICGSDVHGMTGSTGRRLPPVTMGHEASGIIEQVGAAVTDWKVGDRVTMDSTVYCGKCPYCKRGQINLCDDRMVLGVSTPDFKKDGAFAEYVAVPARILYRLPDGLPIEYAAMTEPVSIGYHAWVRSKMQPGETAIVVGSGMIGLLLIQVLKAKGCGKIIAIDIDNDKLTLAQKLGADHALNARDETLIEAIRALTGGEGVDHAFEVVGATAPIGTAIDAVRKGGTVILIGNVSPEVTIHLQKAVTKELNILGSCASSGEYPECLELIAQGHINMEAFISSQPPLADGAEWFKRLYDQEPGLMKVILKP